MTELKNRSLLSRCYSANVFILGYISRKPLREASPPPFLLQLGHYGVSFCMRVRSLTHARGVVFVPETHYIIHLAGRAEALIPSPSHTTALGCTLQQQRPVCMPDLDTMRICRRIISLSAHGARHLGAHIYMLCPLITLDNF